MKSEKPAFTTVMALLTLLAIPVRLAAQQQKVEHYRYKLIDIGTLGGPNSYVGALGGVSQVLSDQGTVAGCADTSTPDPNYPNSPISPPGPDPFIFHSFQWRKGTLTDLGALPGVNSSCPLGISGSGLIVGLSENGDIDPLTGFPEVRATLWKDGEVIDLGTLGGYESVVVSAGNNRGQVAGVATNAIPDPFSGLGTQLRAFLWQRGVMQDLGSLGGPDAFAFDINERGQVVGCAFTNSTPPNPTQDPFLWENGRMTDLGTFGGTYACAFVINNQGQVMGSSNLPGDQVMHAFFWERGTLTDLGSFGGNMVEPFWLNNIGEVVGTAEYPGNTIRHGFLWKKGVITDLGTLYPGCGSSVTGSVALQVNSKTQIVGNSWCDNTAAAGFLWENGGPMVDLNSLIPPNSGMQLLGAQNINERGEITGSGILPNGDVHVCLLIPCGENHGDSECQDEGAAAETQNHAAPGTQTPTNVNHGSLTPETLAALRARMARRYHIHGLGAPRY
jgi:probable HAF family extracellular repeat protein